VNDVKNFLEWLSSLIIVLAMVAVVLAALAATIGIWAFGVYTLLGG
jgi:FlaG/FlaF family flagellin (archaellin)